MAGWNLLDSGTAGFSDGNGGHTYNFPAGAVDPNDLLTISVSSDTVVATPSGWTQVNQDVDQIGAYQWMLVAVGGETNVVITTSGNFPTEIGFLRYFGNLASPLDVTAKARHTAAATNTTPAVTTAALAQTGELSIAAACLGGLGNATQTGPDWSGGTAGYTNILDGQTVETDASGQHLFVGVNTNAGAGAQSPNVTWTNATTNQTILVMVFTPTAGTIITRDVTDSVTVTDTPSSTTVLPRSVSDSVTVSDSPTSRTVLSRTVADSVTVADAATATVVLTRSVADTLTVSDTPTRVVIITRAVTDTITISDVATGIVHPPVRTLVVVFGIPQPKWLFGTFQDTSGIVGGGRAVIQSVLSTSYVQVPVQAYVDGEPLNPTSDTVEMAFVTVGSDPGSGDWKTASWDTAPGGTYLVQCLVGPAGDAVLARGIYGAWTRITDSPEVPINQVGVLQIV